eukprot:scaffold21674_cov39-Attheya_sp.AAC.1
MVIKSSSDGKLWSVPNKIPTFDIYQKHFTVCQTSPPRQAKKITVHFKLHTMHMISHLKHNPQVMMFLQEQKMWMSNDMFKTQKITTVGRITEVHPRLMWTPGLIKELTKAMKEQKMPAADIAKWRAQTQVIEIKQNATDVPVPPFNLVPWNYGRGQVETMMLNMECAENNATYLKDLLSESCHLDKFE